MDKTICIKCNGYIDLQNDIICPTCGALSKQIDIFESMKDTANSCAKLNNKINLLKSYLKTLNLPFDDERNQMLYNLSMMMGWLIIQLDIYQKNAKTTKSSICQKIIQDNPKITMPAINELIQNFDVLHRRSFFTEFMFHVEVFLKSVNRILPKVTQDKGYYNLMTFILKELGIANKNEEKHYIMKFSSFIRNSLHNNGIHTEEDDDGKVSGIHFFYNKGETIETASWYHIVFFCDGILDIFELILKHKLVGKKYMKSMSAPSPL